MGSDKRWCHASGGTKTPWHVPHTRTTEPMSGATASISVAHRGQRAPRSIGSAPGVGRTTFQISHDVPAVPALPQSMQEAGSDASEDR